MTQTASVEKRFTKSAENYDQAARVQKLFASQLLSLFPRSDAVKKIYELGCGSGFLTEGLLEQFPSASISAIDFSEGMLSRAERRCPGGRISWDLSDVHDYEFAEPADLIVSSSALQWMEPLEPLLERLRLVLKPGGRFCFLLPLEKTFIELRELKAELFPDKVSKVAFRSFRSVCEALEGSGFSIGWAGEQQFQERHASGKDFLKSIHCLGFTGGAVSRGKTPLQRGELLKLSEIYETRYSLPDGGCSSSYQIGIFDTH